MFITDKTSAKTFAIKRALPNARGGLVREAKALSCIHAANAGNAPHVVPLAAIVAQPEPTAADRSATPSPTFRTSYVQALLMPVFPGGDLFTHLQQPGTRITSSERWRTTQHLVQGLLAAKAAGVAHCDIKPHNVLRGSNGDVCVADFGFAICGADAATQCTAASGTPLYMSPEVLMCLHAKTLGIPQPYDAFAADVWALGITLTQLALPRLWLALLRGSPRTPGGWPDVRRRVLRAVAAACEPRFVHLITRALAARPVLRATLEELQLIAAVGAAEAHARESAAACARQVAAAEARLAAHCRGAPHIAHNSPAGPADPMANHACTYGTGADPGAPADGGESQPRDTCMHARPLAHDVRLWEAEDALLRDLDRLFLDCGSAATAAREVRP